MGTLAQALMKKGIVIGREEGITQGITQGITRGKKEAQIAIIMKLSNRGMALSEISECVGMSIADIEKILGVSSQVER